MEVKSMNSFPPRFDTCYFQYAEGSAMKWAGATGAERLLKMGERASAGKRDFFCWLSQHLAQAVVFGDAASGPLGFICKGRGEREIKKENIFNI